MRKPLRTTLVLSRWPNKRIATTDDRAGKLDTRRKRFNKAGKIRDKHSAGNSARATSVRS